MDAFPARLSQRCESVKALHVQRRAIRMRLLEKQKLRQQEIRHAHLNAARGSCGSTHSESCLVLSNQNDEKVDECGPLPKATLTGDDWSILGKEFGLDMEDPVIIDYLLALEEEIQQEQLFAMYDSSHSQDQNEWEEYYKSLTS